MKTTILLCTTLFCVASLGLAAEEPHTITVSGTAEVAVAPDICNIQFVITTDHASSAAKAYKENNRLMTEVADAIKELGIEAKDIQTTNFTISPQYHWDDDYEVQVFDGYEVSHSLYVRLRDVDEVSSVLDGAVEAGATQVASVVFTVENPKKYLGDARLEAIRAANAKAAAMCEVAGVELLKPIRILEVEPNSWMRYAAQANVMLERTTVSGGGNASLEPGEVKLSQTVNITYGIR